MIDWKRLTMRLECRGSSSSYERSQRNDINHDSARLIHENHTQNPETLKPLKSPKPKDPGDLQHVALQKAHTEHPKALQLQGLGLRGLGV